MSEEVEERSNRDFDFKVSESVPPLRNWIGKIKAVGTEEFLPNSGALSLILFVDDARFPALCVTSEMNDYEERGEAGRLCFDICRNKEIDTQNLVFFQEIPRPISARKLTFFSEEFSSASGLALSFKDRDDVVIVAAAFPFHISIIGVGEEYLSDPEFKLSEYKEEDVLML